MPSTHFQIIENRAEPGIFLDYVKTLNRPEYLQNVKKHGESYKTYNLSAAFDIETSSFYEKNEKRAIMYVWAFGIGGMWTYGRTWGEFIILLSNIREILGISEEKRLVIYIHNMAFDFQFLRKWLYWDEVFSLDTRKPVYARIGGIEFKCSYQLTGYSLEKVGEHLVKYKVTKKVGDLDYNLIRHSKTFISEKEWGYIGNDVLVVMAAIQEKIENEDGIKNIPLTKTGYVRNYCRKACYKKENYSYYRKLMKNTQLTVDEYMICKRAFWGGFTHASSWHCGQTGRNISSFDFTSSYPAVMIAESGFPMGKGQRVKMPDEGSMEFFTKNINNYACIFDIHIIGLKNKNLIEHPLSKSRCKIVGKFLDSNGRLVWADEVYTTLTEVDFKVLVQFYTWDGIEIGDFWRYKKGYLPRNFVDSILTLYEKKTTLKGLDDFVLEYMRAKEDTNSAYGMCAMDICKILIDYSTYQSWKGVEKSPNYEKCIEDYNESKGRFLSYLWGCYVTAFARRNLFSGILAFGTDYWYSDTDSIKVSNKESHMEYIERYNNLIDKKLQDACKYHGLDYSRTRPKSKDGKEHPLGQWDYEGDYEIFKSLGAKRYAVKKKNCLTVKQIDGSEKKYDYSITVAGVSKYTAVPYMLDKYGEDGFMNAFTNELEIPPEHSGKKTHTYIDEEIKGVVTDYLGVPAEYYERSFIHLESTGYNLSITSEFLKFLEGIERINEVV